MNEQKPDCDAQAGKIALISAGSTFLKTGDPVAAVADFCTTYTAAKTVCEIDKRSGGSGNSKPKE